MTDERLAEIEFWPIDNGNYGSGEADRFIPELLNEIHSLRADLHAATTALRLLRARWKDAGADHTFSYGIVNSVLEKIS